MRQLNGALRDHRYHDDVFKAMTGEDVESLWKVYKVTLGEKAS